jgi:hypothetical protein
MGRARSDSFTAVFGSVRGTGKAPRPLLPQVLLSSDVVLGGRRHHLEVTADSLYLLETNKDGQWSHRVYLSMNELIELFSSPAGVGSQAGNRVRSRDQTVLTFWRSERPGEDGGIRFCLDANGPQRLFYASVNEAALQELQSRLQTVLAFV